MEGAPLEDLVLSGGRWRSLWSQPGSDCSAVWTHPELLPQVALINHATISLTLLCLSWQNPVLPAPQSLGFTGWLNELLRGSLYCLLALLNCRPVITVQLWSPWSPNQVVRGLCPSSQCTEGPSPETSREGSFLSSRQFHLQGIGSDSSSLYQPNIMPRWIHHLTKAGCIHGRCKTCFWVKSSALTSYIYL